jgi:hypothetical protein
MELLPSAYLVRSRRDAVNLSSHFLALCFCLFLVRFTPSRTSAQASVQARSTEKKKTEWGSRFGLLFPEVTGASLVADDL